MPRKYRKTIKIVLETEAKNKEEAKLKLNKVAHGIHSLGHPLTTGGKKKRTVAVSHNSTDITFIPKRKDR